jgi:hypothetical protein
MVLLLAAVVLAPSGAEAGAYGIRMGDGRTLSVSVPEECRMKSTGIRGGISCDWQATDGGFRGIVLEADTLPVKKFTRTFGLDHAQFLANPDEAMSVALQRIEALATGDPPGPGQKLLRADAKIVSAAKTVKGLDRCLQFEFDWLGPLDDGTMMRFDNSGIRCLTLDRKAGTITMVMLENLNSHLTELQQRQAGHQKEAERSVKSLRVQ